MARRKKSAAKPADHQDWVSEVPNIIDLRRKLTASTREARTRLKKATNAAELRAFWEARSEDLLTDETQAEAVQYCSFHGR